MGNHSFNLIIGLLIFYELLPASVTDIHVSPPSENREIERQHHEQQKENDWETTNDESRSDQERREALDRLIDNNDIV